MTRSMHLFFVVSVLVVEIYISNKFKKISTSLTNLHIRQKNNRCLGGWYVLRRGMCALAVSFAFKWLPPFYHARIRLCLGISVFRVTTYLILILDYFKRNSHSVNFMSTNYKKRI